MDVGIIGVGTVGEHLGQALAAAGHVVRFGVRDPAREDVRDVVRRAEGNLEAFSVPEAAAFGDVVALAVPHDALPDVCERIEPEVRGTPVIDASNRIGGGEGTHDGSVAETVRERLPDADVVKALNTIGAEHYRDPTVAGEAATMFVAGDDPEAKATVLDLVADLGFDAVDAGKLDAAGHLEHLAELWVHLARRRSRNVAFKFLRE